MQRIAQFSKVSYNQFFSDWSGTFKDYDKNQIEEIYNKIKMPKRATSGSAGYDFYAPCKIELSPREEILIPTGIRVMINDGWVLKCYPRSSLGFKYRLQLNNTVGIIDSDYYYSDNEGHIFAKITNDTTKEISLCIDEGSAFMQGVFSEFGITFDDDSTDIRNGGFGSTN